MNNNKSKISCKRGFTLIELLVVVLIIGILAAVAVPQYQLAVAKSRYATLKNLVHSIKNAQEIYYLANDRYTNKLENLDIEFPTNGTLNEAGDEIAYVWGTCKITSEGVNCSNSQIYLEYQEFFDHTSLVGKKQCVASSLTNTVANKICVIETKDDSPYQGSGYRAYSYN